ncbi:MAG: thioesterase family protein [Myxococcota bacterium]
MHSFPPDTLSFPVLLQRNAFGPRLVARAGDVWRAMQDVVVDQSMSVGWTPERFVETGTMFIVRSMTVQHLRDVRFAESLQGRTWPSRARRDMLFTREVRLFSGDELVIVATQEWAYLSRALEPIRAGKDIYDAFRLHEGYPSVKLPEYQRVDGSPVHHFGFTTWHLWMDPNAHVNHPAYVDYCDEGTHRVLAARGIDPQRLTPVAEEVHFRAAIGPEEEVQVETTYKGAVGDAAVLGHRILVKGKVAATCTAVRRLADEAGDGWHAALR